MGLGVQGHRDMGRGACHRHSVPVHPVLILVPCHRAGRQHTPLSQHGQPQKHHPIWCNMRHSPSSPSCPKPLCPAQTGTGVVAVVTASSQTTGTGGHGHQHSLHKEDCSTACPQLALPRGTRGGAEQPQGPLLTWGSPSPWWGPLGQKDSAKVLGTLRRQRTLQRQGEGSSCILAPSCLPMQGAQGNPALLPPPCMQTPRQKNKSS